MRERAQDRYDNDVAARNAKGERKQDGEEHGGRGKYGSH